MIYSHHRNGDFSYITVNETESDDPDYTKVNSSTLDSPNHENFTAYDFESYNLIVPTNNALLPPDYAPKTFTNESI